MRLLPRDEALNAGALFPIDLIEPTSQLLPHDAKCSAPQIPPGKLTEKARTVALLGLRNPERRAIGFDKAVECVALHETDEVEVAPFIAEWIRKAREMRDEGFRLYRSLMRKVQEAMRPARFPPAE